MAATSQSGVVAVADALTVWNSRIFAGSIALQSVCQETILCITNSVALARRLGWQVMLKEQMVVSVASAVEASFAVDLEDVADLLAMAVRGAPAVLSTTPRTVVLHGVYLVRTLSTESHVVPEVEVDYSSDVETVVLEPVVEAEVRSVQAPVVQPGSDRNVFSYQESSRAEPVAVTPLEPVQWQRPEVQPRVQRRDSVMEERQVRRQSVVTRRPKRVDAQELSRRVVATKQEVNMWLWMAGGRGR